MMPALQLILPTALRYSSVWNAPRLDKHTRVVTLGRSKQRKLVLTYTVYLLHDIQETLVAYGEGTGDSGKRRGRLFTKQPFVLFGILWICHPVKKIKKKKTNNNFFNKNLCVQKFPNTLNKNTRVDPWTRAWTAQAHLTHRFFSSSKDYITTQWLVESEDAEPWIKRNHVRETQWRNWYTGRVGTPMPHTVQGSTVVLILRLLFIGSFSCSHKYSLGSEKATVSSHCTYELGWKIYLEKDDPASWRTSHSHFLPSPWMW